VAVAKDGKTSRTMFFQGGEYVTPRLVRLSFSQLFKYKLLRLSGHCNETRNKKGNDTTRGELALVRPWEFY